MQTTLSITGLQFYGYHGLFAEEQRLGQKFRMNVKARMQRAESHLNDDLQASVRYEVLLEHLLATATQTKYRTLETLAEVLARSALQQFDCINHVAVEVAKVSPPVPQSVDQVSIEVTLDRIETS